VFKVAQPELHSKDTKFRNQSQALSHLFFNYFWGGGRGKWSQKENFVISIDSIFKLVFYSI
jgi:hypothetical protein